MLDDAQLADFHNRGHVRLPRVVGAAAIETMQSAVWSFLEQRGVDRDRSDGWPSVIDKLQPLRRQRAFDPFLVARLDDVCDQLIGTQRWTDLGAPPQALLSLPVAGPWRLPTKSWHFDLPARGATEPLGALRFLGFVDDVEPSGGGTLVVEGTHRLVDHLVEASPAHDVGSSSDVRKMLAHHDFFSHLSGAESAPEDFGVGADDIVDDVAVQVAELTGRAGDLVVMHPWLLHNVAMNCSARPRMMMSYTRYSSDASWF